MWGFGWLNNGLVSAKGLFVGRAQRGAGSAAAEAESVMSSLGKLSDNSSADALKGTLDTHLDALKDATKAHTEAIIGGNKATIKAAEKELSTAVKNTEKAVHGGRSFLKTTNAFERGMKLGKFGLRRAGLVGAAVVAGIGGLAWWAHSSRKNAEQESRQAMRDQKAMAAQDFSAGGNTMMGLEPAPGAFAARVQAGRGIGAQAGVDASNPNLASPDGRPIQDLGAVRA